MRNLVFTSQWKAQLSPLSSTSSGDKDGKQEIVEEGGVLRRSYCIGRHGELFIIEQQKEEASLITSKLKLIDFGNGVGGDESNNWEQTTSNNNGVCLSLDDCPSSWITQVQFNPDTECVYFSTENGQFCMLDRTNLQQLTELFHSEEGLASFCVSPDGRHVAVATNKRSVLLMSIPYVECVAQHNHHQSKLSKSHEADVPATDTKLLLNDSDVSIVWRSDSKYFAINILSESDKRCIAVYDEAGLFVSRTEESVILLNASLTWQPSGGLLAAFGFSPTSKNSVLLFEKNGLQRAEFSVSSSGTENDKDIIRRLQWNVDSTILAIIYDTRVDLWTRSNYVWMLKRTVKYFLPNTTDHVSIVSAKWDCRLGSRLHVIYDDEKWSRGRRTYFRYDVDFKYTTDKNGAALTCWWNGPSLYYTPFRDFCAPPPNGYGQVMLDGNVSCVISSPERDEDSICIVDSLSNFSILKYSLGKKELSPVGVFKSVGFSVDPTIEWLWLSPSVMLSVTPGSSSISVYLLNPTEFTVICLGDISVKSFTGDATLNNLKHIPTIRRIFRVQESSSFVICEIFERSILLLVDLSSILENILNLGRIDLDTLINVISLCSFPQNFTSLELLRTSDEKNTNSQTSIIIAHDAPSKNLYIQWNRQSDFNSNNSGIKLSFDCTSVCVFDNHLLFTTTGSLQIFKAERLLAILEKSSSEDHNEVDAISVDTEKYLRKIEKGSTIVTCCVNRMLEPSLVLQIIPRGNVEVIFPRPLLIESFSKSLRKVDDEHRYSKIMTAIRRHRVDYRVLIDEMKLLASEQESFSVETQLRLMINEVQNSHSLVLLVTDLNEEYFDCIRMIKDILQTIIVQSEGSERERNLEEAYLASLAKLGLFEEALNSHLIKGEKDSRQFVTERVKFLSYYCDNPDTLFDTAIGTYDLTLASLVADCLGKDPKEFVPILDGFQAVSSEYGRRFKIDEKLRRFSKAIRHLINDNQVQADEVLKYMDRHRLYTDAVEYITTSLEIQEETSDINRNEKTDRLKELLKESKSHYGKYLEEHNRVKEASLMYRQGGNFPKAVDCAVKSGSWEQALEIFYSSETSEDLHSLCNRLILQLEELKNYGAAAVVAEEYLKDPMRAVELHMRNRRWMSARLCAQKNKELRDNKYAEELITPKLEEFAREHLQSLESLRVDLNTKKDRLKIAKALKQKKLDEGTGGDFDNFSDTSSISTTSSIRSGSSGSASSGRSQRSKNRRKMERKLQSMKEGSAYEDLAITAYLWNTIERVEAEVKRETSELVESLWAFELSSLARSMGTEMDNLVSTIISILKEVWEILLTDELLETKYRVPPPSWTTVWDKLSLHESSSKATSSSKQHN